MPPPLMVQFGDASISVSELARQHDLDRKLVTKRLAKARAQGLSDEEGLKEALQPKKPDPISPRYITIENQTKTVIEWSKDRGILESTIRMRIDRDGWTEREALEFDERPKPLHPIVRWAFREMNRQGLSMRAMERLSGLSRMVFVGWKCGSSPVLGHVVIVAMTLGFDLNAGGKAVQSGSDLVDWMLDESRKSGFSMIRLSEISGVPYKRITDWKARRGMPLLSSFAKCLDALGLKFPKPVKR